MIKSQSKVLSSELVNYSPHKIILDSYKLQSFTNAPSVVAVANVQPQVISSGIFSNVQDMLWTMAPME